MSANEQPHTPRDRLRAFAQGRVAAAELEAIQTHLEHCPSCCAALEQAVDEDPFLSHLRKVWQRRPGSPGPDSGPADG
jgi:hypothetical protein